MKYYHVTPKQNLESIMKDGLVKGRFAGIFLILTAEIQKRQSTSGSDSQHLEATAAINDLDLAQLAQRSTSRRDLH